MYLFFFLFTTSISITIIITASQPVLLVILQIYRAGNGPEPALLQLLLHNTKNLIYSLYTFDASPLLEYSCLYFFYLHLLPLVQHLQALLPPLPSPTVPTPSTTIPTKPCLSPLYNSYLILMVHARSLLSIGHKLSVYYQWRREGGTGGTPPPRNRKNNCCRNLVLSSRSNTSGAGAEII